VSAIVWQPYLMARKIGAVLHYLHLDLVITGLVLATVLATGWAKRLDPAPAIRWAVSSVVGNDASPAVSPAMESPPQSLTPGLQAVLDATAQRYRVSADALQPVFEAVQAVARERNLDPLLIIAVIGIESRFNPFSQSPMGAQGLMQIIPRFHLEKIPRTAGELPFLDPVVNVRIGSQILQDAIRRQGGVVEGLQSYAGASDDEEKAYANKVLAEKQRLEQVARRRDLAPA